MLAESFQNAGVAAAHVAEHFPLQARFPRRVKPLNRRPDKRGGSVRVGKPELCFEQRFPHFLKCFSARKTDEPVFDRNLFKLFPIIDSRSVKNRRAETKLTD